MKTYCHYPHVTTSKNNIPSKQHREFTPVLRLWNLWDYFAYVVGELNLSETDSIVKIPIKCIYFLSTAKNFLNNKKKRKKII